MADVVAVGKLDLSAGVDGQYMWRKLLITLIH